MATHSVKLATKAELVQVLDNLREADEAEFVGLTKMQLIEKNFNRSICFAGYYEDSLACVYGVYSTSFVEPGQLWLASTNIIEQRYIRFLRESIRFVDWALKEYGVLGGIVTKRNVRSQKWLKFLGFTLGEEIELPPLGPVYPFKRSLF